MGRPVDNETARSSRSRALGIQGIPRIPLHWRVYMHVKKHSTQLALGILMLQIMFIFFRLNMRAMTTTNKASGASPDYVYNYAYVNDRAPREPQPEPKHPSGDPRRGHPHGNNVHAGRDLVVRYDEDYDHLDYEPGQILRQEHHEPEAAIGQNGEGQPEKEPLVVPEEKSNNPADMFLVKKRNKGKAGLEMEMEEPERKEVGKKEIEAHQPDLILAPIKAEHHIDKADDPLVEANDAAPQPDPAKSPRSSKTTIRLCSMAERVKHMETYCDNTDIGDKRPVGYRKSRYGGLLVDERHKLIFCDVSQMASVVWMTLLVKATGEVNSDRPPIRNRKFLNKIGLKYLDSYSTEQRGVILKNFFKFLVVQHPFDRLVSQWQTKLVDAPANEPFKRKLGHEILLSKRRIGNRPITEDEIPSRETVQFDELVEFAFVDKNMVDPTWFSYVQVCHPCEIHYNAILRVDTFRQDAGVILSRFADYNAGIPDGIFVPTELDLVHGKYNIKSFRNVTKSAQDILMNKYQHDIGLFGYSWNSTSHNATCSIRASDAGVCC